MCATPFHIDFVLPLECSVRWTGTRGLRLLNVASTRLTRLLAPSTEGERFHSHIRS
jgi:hypothetical protein